jgi:hypothetical protein
MDKIGHAYVSHLCYHAIYEAMTWAEFTPRQILQTSIALPAFWALSIEIGDAFSPYGFSVPDLAANFAGIGYGVLQHKVPFFKNIAFKNVSFKYDNSNINCLLILFFIILNCILPKLYIYRQLYPSVIINDVIFVVKIFFTLLI